MKWLKGLGVFLLVLVAMVVAIFIWGSGPAADLQGYQEVFEDPQFQASNKTASDTFSIITYNIGWLSGMTNNRPVYRPARMYRDNTDKAVYLFQKLDPDIIAFQEIDVEANRSYGLNQVTAFQNRCGFPFTHTAINWNTKYVPFPYWPPKMHYGSLISAQAIVSKIPITSHETKVLQPPMDAPFYYRAFYLDRLAEAVVLDVSGQPLAVINVHLEAFSRDTRIAQAKELIEFYREFARQYPVLLVGDFNSVPPYKEVRGTEWEEPTITYFLTEPNLKEVILKDKIELSDSASYTFPSRLPAGKIDYIFYTSDRLEVLDARVVHEAEEISDHLPVMAKFIFKNEENL